MAQTQQELRKDGAGKLFVLGIQHLFAMFGATVLVAILTGLDPMVTLFCAGVGTIIFHLVTKGKVPTFLGSSFAFIGGIISVGMMKSGGAAVGTPEYMAALPYATGAIIVAGAIYILMAVLVYFLGADRILRFFPPVITGPMVIIIGMMLAPSAINNITTVAEGGTLLGNWTVAIATILIIIICSLLTKGFFKLVPILFGIAGGYVVSLLFGMVDTAPIAQASWVAIPSFFLPKFDWSAILLIAPISLVTFAEHVADITANGQVTGNNFIKDPGLHRTLLGDGLATMFAGAVGGPSNTTYSENTGVLAATKNYNPVTLRIAAVIAIVMSFVLKFGTVLESIPAPVIGGISVILYGMIAVVGLRTLVENKVDFTNTRNLMIVAVMLVFGLGLTNGISFTVNVTDPVTGVAAQNTFAISGQVLAAILGILLNAFLPGKPQKAAALEGDFNGDGVVDELDEQFRNHKPNDEALRTDSPIDALEKAPETLVYQPQPLVSAKDEDNAKA